MTIHCAPGVSILGPVSAEHAAILTPEAQAFVALLHRCFNARRLQLLAARDSRQKELDAGRLPDFLPHTAAIRDDVAWLCAPPAPGLVDRRVEITVRDVATAAVQPAARCGHLHLWPWALDPCDATQNLPIMHNLHYLAAAMCQGPVDRKMVINALNSGATQFMADFEGEPSP